ncbi:hypothetical protein B0H19DRAFT_1069784 [Mycena capillaripes]|nr:hypothetical protein B0H19DRAFT_1069784 [Mycena capillaripes]
MLVPDTERPWGITAVASRNIQNFLVVICLSASILGRSRNDSAYSSWCTAHTLNSVRLSLRQALTCGTRPVRPSIFVLYARVELWCNNTAVMVEFPPVHVKRTGKRNKWLRISDPRHSSVISNDKYAPTSAFNTTHTAGYYFTMVRTREPRHAAHTALELGDANPLDDNEIPDPERVILKVTLTTSSPTLSLSNPDPFFRLLLDVEIFHSPRPNSALTISTGRSAVDVRAYSRGAICLYGTTEGQPSLLIPHRPCPHYMRQDVQNKDLLRDPEFEWLKFITVPASGSVRVEIPLPLETILRRAAEVDEEDLKPGMKYSVWMKSSFLGHLGRYTYWGDLAQDLKHKKLSSYRPNPDGSPAENSSDYAADVVAADGSALQRYGRLVTRGNVGRFGPTIEFVE